MDLLNISQAKYDEVLFSLSSFDRLHPTEISNMGRYRRECISKTMEFLVKQYPYIQPYEIWKSIEKAHIISFISGSISLPSVVLNTSQLIDFLLNGETLQAFSSAGQSWKRASGVAWEDFISRNLLLSNEDVEIKILTPVEMGLLLHGNALANNIGDPITLAFPSNEEAKKEYEDFLNKILNDKNFDLFLVYYVPFTKEWKLFGLIQCKTSIRDRIKINMKSSEEAMGRSLWSIVIAMDSDRFTRSGQYNKGAKESWNGFYVLDNKEETDGSIYYGDLSTIQQTIRNHCSQVIKAQIMDTKSINADWKAIL
ncbi:BsaWI family type II restriction enzyme [Paenibacillus polymyxa]|uniref:BsaWI family type II restriction enzyme n=1 Tax=Paenibacillus polymyxa TaxID=1406 RepID=UPI0003D29E68|nr:BsaWI family type II restriction enzyme [Paenibacillus polymyxa]AIW42382.1 hypothetical protein X809_41815 [Paenibacillus polymyxa CR1]